MRFPPVPTVYVASPYVEAGFVKTHVHPHLRALGWIPTSTWAEAGDPQGSGDDLAKARAAIAQNDYDVRRSHALLVLPKEDRGAETYAELRFACLLGLSVIYVADEKLMLSAFRPEVVRVPTLDAAYRELTLLHRDLTKGP